MELRNTIENELINNFAIIESYGTNLKEYTVLFADFGGSTILVDRFDVFFSSWLLKSYLSCVSRIITFSGGGISAFEGDGIMAIFDGKNKESDAVKCAFKIQWAVENIIQLKINEFFPNYKYTMSQVVGIDTSKLAAVKTNIWDNYDILWVGRAANYSAILTSINNINYSTYVTEEVFSRLSKDLIGDKVNEIWTEVNKKILDTKIYQSKNTLKL